MHGALPLAGGMSQFVLRETASRAYETWQSVNYSIAWIDAKFKMLLRLTPV